jgi:cytosine/adenosine deaminase-related metal-dependent hydrolase
MRVAFGTDSLASNPSLDPRAELRRAHQLFPEIAAQELLRMSCAEAGDVVGVQAGVLAVGRPFLALSLHEIAPIAKGAEEACRWLIENQASFTAHR